MRGFGALGGTRSRKLRMCEARPEDTLPPSIWNSLRKTPPSIRSVAQMIFLRYSQTPLIRPSVVRLNGSPPKNGLEPIAVPNHYIDLWLIRQFSNPPKIV